MKDLFRRLRKFRPCILIAFALLSPALLTQCKSTAGTYKDIEYDPATLKTPSGHGLEKKEYPFDDEGNYRKDWVKNKTTGKTRSASKLPEPTAPVDAGTVASTPAAPPAGGYVGPADGAAATTVAAAAPPEPSPAASPRYHKIGSGDTLFSLASRYGTTVDELKRVNGLSSDTIHLGQSLRIP